VIRGMGTQVRASRSPIAVRSSTWAGSGLLQRKCACGEPGQVGGECAECRKKKEGTLQRASTLFAPPSEVPPIVHEVLRSPGQPLDVATRAGMESRFRHDFSQVRVHADGRSAHSAAAIGAHAYTLGQQVVFASGQYRPDTIPGTRLLAHELVHTIQQGRLATVPERLELSDPSDPAEQTARALSADLPSRDACSSLSPTVGPHLAREASSAAAAPDVFVHNTELGGLSVGNFDFHFRNCAILVWVWLKFKFANDISGPEQAAFKERFLKAVHGTWAHTGYSVKGTGRCPCGTIPIEVHCEETSKGGYHKLVDVEKKTDVQRRPKVISDINVNLFTSDDTLAHEFGHVLGLYDEYDGGFWENIMFWHKNQPGDDAALMSSGAQLRPRYFEHYRKQVQKTAPKDCTYSVSSPVPPVP
jgi:hypothetical protein